MDRIFEILLGQIDVKLFIVCVLIFTPLEHILPIRRPQWIIRPGWLTDVAHFVFTAFLSRFGLTFLIICALALGELATPEAVTQWAFSQPLWLQVVMCTIIADLGFYAAHRLMHEVPWLWRFHAIHHSSEHLDWLAAYRVHPVDQVIVKGTSLVLVVAIGFSAEAIAIAGLIYQAQALLIHSNVRIGFGRLGMLAASPEFHHWHHANEPAAFNKNYSGQLPFWDWLFGTLHAPGHFPSRYGTDDKVPSGYLGQLGYPFERTTPPEHVEAAPRES